MTEPAIDSTATEVHENGHEPERALALPAVPAQSALAVAPTVEATELVTRLDAIKSAADTAMTEGVDYGEIPGTNKPTLLKPGAEKLGVLFQLDIQLANEKVWGPGEHLTVISHATVFHAPSGARVGYGEGVCTTKEKKYAKRQSQRKCPECGEEAVIKGKKEYGGGWLCFKKKGGCGHKWPDGAKEIEGQEVGEVDNPELPDLWNTVVKMAEKRARVDAVLAVTGASAIFTQDIEDAPRSETPPAEEAPPPPAEPDPRKPDDLPEDRVNAIGRSIGAVGVSFERLGVLFSSAGAEGPAINRSDSLRKALRALTPEQATKLEGLLSNEADRG